MIKQEISKHLHASFRGALDVTSDQTAAALIVVAQEIGIHNVTLQSLVEAANEIGSALANSDKND